MIEMGVQFWPKMPKKVKLVTLSIVMETIFHTLNSKIPKEAFLPEKLEKV